MEDFLPQFLAIFMFICGVFVWFLLTFTALNAPYGRYSHQALLWSPKVSVPARWGWVLQEMPSVLIPTWFLIFSPKVSTIALILLLPFLCHYVQRAFVYPCLIRGSKDIPLLTFLLALIFCIFNGYLQASYHINFLVYSPHHLKKTTTIIGFLLFISGMVINLHSDHVLRTLRQPGDAGYKIPRGGIFELVSCGNFFGEIVEWTGWWLMTGSLASAGFAFFTAANLGPRALSHHQYYQKKFQDYPQNRKALIPFLL